MYSATLEVTVTGVPLWLLQEYVQELGGRPELGGWLYGDGWRVRLTPIEDYQIGSLRVGQVHLELEGHIGRIQQIHTLLQKKLLRAGG